MESSIPPELDSGSGTALLVPAAALAAMSAASRGFAIQTRKLPASASMLSCARSGPDAGNRALVTVQLEYDAEGVDDGVV